VARSVVLAVVQPRFGLLLLLGWGAPWLPVGWVVATADAIPWVPYPALTTLVYVLTLCVACYRAGHRRQGLVADAGGAAEKSRP
jgi:hypothetical protein